MELYIDEEDGTVFEVAHRKGFPLRSDCGGKGQCGKCLVRIKQTNEVTPISDAERLALSPEKIREGWRLACQVRSHVPIPIEIPASSIETKEFLSKNVSEGSYPCDPIIDRFSIDQVTVSNDSVTARDIVSLIVDKARTQRKKVIRFSEATSVKELSQSYFSDGQITVVNCLGRGVITVLKGDRKNCLGVAVDIGTTTLAVYLCDLRNGKVVGSSASLNPQRAYGEDVISRVNFANERAKGVNELCKLVISEVNRLIHRCLKGAAVEVQDIDEVLILGNTTMEHLFLGFHPHCLGVAPYLPIKSDAEVFTAGDLGLDLNPGANVHVFPVISGFVGGDTVGVMLAEEPHLRKEVSLIVDIGTNGEVILGNSDQLWVTSCATGPAFEGAHISCGMRATHGAISKVDIDSSTLRVVYSFFGENGALGPSGICGSGIIDTVAAMRKVGLLLENGRIKEGLPGVVVDDNGIGRSFLLVPADETATGEEIKITLDDIRQIQLAKAALATGIKLLMCRAKISSIDRLVLTGAFGARFDLRNAVSIGMLPRPAPETEIKVVENSAGIGAIMALLDQKRRREAVYLSKFAQFMELSREPAFLNEFPMAMSFP